MRGDISFNKNCRANYGILELQHLTLRSKCFHDEWVEDAEEPVDITWMESASHCKLSHTPHEPVGETSGSTEIRDLLKCL